MKVYESTRGCSDIGSFSDVLLSGLAPDGGLAVPKEFEYVSKERMTTWSRLSYPDLAREILQIFAPEICNSALKKITAAAYSAEFFGGSDIISLRKLKSEKNKTMVLLGLSNGPTLAFKDIAMQFLGQSFEFVLSERGKKLNILGATSGDTGSAEEYALKGKESISVFMLSPENRMTPFQRAQMYSLQEKNIFNISIPGTFDTCQDLVKGVAGDLEFKSTYSIGSVNSINWGRLSAQIVYYFFGYFRTLEYLNLNLNNPVSFAVPSGNFGNILSGYYAKKMGLPIKNLVLATNENNVLDEFFKTGKYRIRTGDETLETSSPSMDIAKASNFERFVFDVLGNDSSLVNFLWKELKIKGYFSLDKELMAKIKKNSGIVSGCSKHENRVKTINSYFKDCSLIMDPHTADGVFISEKFCEREVPMICLETAKPYKFEQTIFEAIGFMPQRPKSFRGIEKEKQICFKLPNDLEVLKEFISTRAKIR